MHVDDLVAIHAQFSMKRNWGTSRLRARSAQLRQAGHGKHPKKGHCNCVYKKNCEILRSF